jgi:two-component system sensor histidine kinase MtrB
MTTPRVPGVLPARVDTLVSARTRLTNRLRPLIRRAATLWRRSIQVRVVVATLLLSLFVVALLGAAVVGQVRDGLLRTKTRAALSQAEAGFRQAQQEFDAHQEEPKPDMRDLLTRVAQNRALGGGSAGLFEIALLIPQPGEGGGLQALGPRTTGYVSPASVPQDLRDEVESQKVAYRYMRLSYERDQSGSAKKSQPALAVGTVLLGPDNRFYELYYLFPLTQEQATLNLVQRTLGVAGLFLVVLLGGIAWLITRQVVNPVRMAARISERLAAGHLEERMRFGGEDDLARLSSSFNKMATSLQRQIRQLEDLSRVQRRFVSDVSHELRTPLTTVRMAADVLHEARQEFDPAVSRSAELLQAQLDRFEALLTDLLEISRFDAGAAVLDAEPVDIRDLAHRVVEAAEPLAERRGTELVVEAPSTPCVAEVDPRRIERVVRNLVVNAVEHAEGGKVLVRIAANESAVAVAVRDYGVGLKPGESSLVFNRFWRADPARARTTGGTGLGLAIALEDAHLHGGWLQAWGEPGDGSQFRLTVPREAGRSLDRSPLGLEPADSRHNRGMASAGVPYRRSAPADGEVTGDGEASIDGVPVEPSRHQPATAVAAGESAGSPMAPGRRGPRVG